MRWFFVVLMLWAVPVQAEWRAWTDDDGALFYGVAEAGSRLMRVTCIGPSRGGVPPMQVGAHETAPTPVYGFRIELAPQLVTPLGEVFQRDDLAIWVDGAGFRLPLTTLNGLDGVWTVNVPMTDPMVQALRGARDVIVGPLAGPHYRVAAAGLGDALAQVTRFCVAEYQRLGHQLPAGLSGYGAVPGVDLTSAVQRDLASGCPFGMSAEPGHLLRGDIDGDGVDDLVVDWGKIACAGSMPRPHCGASMCSADVYLSRRYLAQGRPENLLALGVSMIPLSNGLQGLSLGGSLSSCDSAGKGPGGCQFIWYWNGADLVRLP